MEVNFMYLDVSPFTRYLEFSWDIFVLAVILVAIIYVFGNMMISTGIPQFYIERYVYTLFSSIVGYQLLFSLIFYSEIHKTIKMFGFPVINLSNLVADQFLAKIVTYTSSSAALLFFFFLVTTPLLALYQHFFRNDTELRQNRILIKPYVKTLLSILFATIIMLFTTLSF
jgi:hypothetical protein